MIHNLRLASTRALAYGMQNAFCYTLHFDYGENVL